MANIWQKKAARDALNYIKDLLVKEKKKIHARDTPRKSPSKECLCKMKNK